MGFVSAIFFFSTVYYLWRRCAINLDAKGRGRLFRHGVASLLALTLGLFQTILLNGDGWISIGIGLALALGSIFIAGRPSTAAIHSAPPLAPSPEYRQSEIARAVYEAEPGPDDLLTKWKAAAPSKAPRQGVIADIEFDYRDARGNDSHRHVAVQAVAREHLQGYCYKAHDTRTFRVDGMRGKVLDVETGELLPPRQWAAAVRADPLNDPSLIRIGSDDAEGDEELAPPAADAIEICFTGFSKADKLRLEGMAHSADMLVRQSVTVGLTHLVTGKKAGPKKLEQAEEVGAEVIDETEFYEFVSTV